MSRLSLSFAFGRNPRTAPIFDGEVEVPGIELLASPLRAGEIFWRQLKLGQFDVSEMSMSSYFIATDRGISNWVAVPVFTTRSFFHTDILVSANGSIYKPQDLRGKRVGLPEYQMSAAVWARGALQTEFGVSASDIEWYMERSHGKSHGSATGFEAPNGVSLTYVPPETSTVELLLSGKIDALLRYVPPGLLDRGRLDPNGDGRVRYLFDDRVGEGRRYFGATGLYPANHTLVVKKSVVEEHPWVPINLFLALKEAKLRSEARLKDEAAIYAATGDWTIGQRDLLPYGVEANRQMLETFARYSYEQGLTSQPLPMDRLFDVSVLDV